MVSTLILSSLLVAVSSVCAIPVPASAAVPVPEVNDSLVKPIAVRGVVSHKNRPHHPILPVIPKLSTRGVASVKDQSTDSDKAHVSESHIANPSAVNESSLPGGTIDHATKPLHVPVRNTEDASIKAHLPSGSHTRHAHPHRRCSPNDSSTDSHSRSHSTTDSAGIPSLDASVGTSAQSGADITARPSGAGTNILLDINDSANIGTHGNPVDLSPAVGTHDSTRIVSNTGTKLHPTVDAASPLGLGTSILADVKSNTNALDTGDHSTTKGQGHGSSCGHT